MKIAYFDCFSGASGDMLLGALLDCGLDPALLQTVISSLGLDKACKVKIAKVVKNYISATQLSVQLTSEDQPHRTLSDIKEILYGSELSQSLKARSLGVFQRLAQAEAKVHGCSPDEIHFHEVGAVDCLVDVVGVLAGLEALGVREVYTSPLPLGSGFVKAHHGKIPLPSPATVELLKGIPVYGADVNNELVTPTGAALIAECSEGFGPMPAMKIISIGYGAGSTDLPAAPNVARLIMGERLSDGGVGEDLVAVLHTSIDDTTPELMGYVMERLMEEGALDVAFFPVQMKKNRPGLHVEVMARPQDARKLSDILLSETTTLGIRHQVLQRRVLERCEEEITSPWGPMRVKKVRSLSGEVRVLPEYEACKLVAKQHKLPLGQVLTWVERLNE